MRLRTSKIFITILTVTALLFCTVMQTAALDDKYTFSDIGMTLKIPKTLTVITKDSERTDEAFAKVGLDYDETITAFNAAHIYLQAFDPDGAFKITLTVTSDDNSESINNYSDISAQQREDILNTYLSDSMCTGAVEIKHGGNIYFDITLESGTEDAPLYIRQSNTVINGYNINLTLQKEGESILNEEAKVLTNIANSLTFDKITLNNSGPSFEWWRFLIWIVILAALSFGISFAYKRYNLAQKKKLEERRRRHAAALTESRRASASDKDSPNPVTTEGEPSFDEILGYESDDDYQSRAATDLESFDINVKEKNKDGGVSYFEDSGDGIDDGTDYFDTYFKEPTVSRTPVERAAGTVGAYLKIAFNHLGYFFKNIFKAISKFFKGNKTNIQK